MFVHAERGPTLRYREHRPHPALEPLVECYWSIRGRAEATRFHRVLPDGCMDLLFDLSDGASRLLPGRPRAAVVGCMTRSMRVGYEGGVDLCAVRFRPGGAAGFLGVDAREWTDHVGNLEDLWGAGGRETWHRLGEAGSSSGRVVDSLAAVGLPAGDDRNSEAADAADAARRVGILDRFLLDRCPGAEGRADPLMVRAARQIEHREGRIRVADLARGLGLSRRQLERRFAATVGTSPKLAARIARFRGVVDSLHRDPGVSLASLALRQGYSDQAHMTRDFVDFAHRPPGAYRQELLGADPG